MSEELLKVLDLGSQEAQIKALYRLSYEYFVFRKCGRDGGKYECREGSLADLAFRLRDEVDFNLYVEACQEVYRHWLKHGTILDRQENTLITYTCWLVVYITPIDRIIAALIAKGKEQ